MPFATVVNYLNEDKLLFFQHKVMEHSEGKIYYATVIAYAFIQYSLKRGLKEIGEKGGAAVTDELFHIHIRDRFRPESYEHLTKEHNFYAL